MRQGCIICNQKNLIKFTRGGKDYPLKKCPSCNLVFDENITQNREDLYSENYFVSADIQIKGGYPNYFEESIVNKLTFKYRLNKINRLVGSKKVKLLDIGCSLGDFLEVARSLLFPNISGIEISDFAVKQCREKGLKVYKSGKGDTYKVLSSESFDVITLQDVVEHFKDPKVELIKIFKLLKPGGLLFLTTPNIGSISEKIFRKNWYHYKKGEHLYYFNNKNIRLFLEGIGFSDIQVSHTPSWVHLNYLIDRLRFYFPKLIPSTNRSFFNNPIFMTTFPIYVGEMEVFARKPSSI